MRRSDAVLGGASVTLAIMVGLMAGTGVSAAWWGPTLLLAIGVTLTFVAEADSGRRS